MEAGIPSDDRESHLVACVQENLALYMFENAIFLGERLVANYPTEVRLTHRMHHEVSCEITPSTDLIFMQGNVYLLATCYHRANQSYRAYHLLKGLTEPQSRYLFALCCMQLGPDKFTEAELALMPNNDSSKVPNGAAGYYLCGRILQLTNRHTAAIAYYNIALNLDPTMWVAYEELCALGAEQEIQHYISPPAGQPTPQQPATGHGVPAHSPAEAMETSTIAATDTPPVPQGQTTPMGAPGTFRTPTPAGAASGPPPIPRANNGWQNNGPSSIPMLAGNFVGSSMQEQREHGAPKLRKVSNKLFSEPASVLKNILAAHGASPADSEALMELGAVLGIPRGQKSDSGLDRVVRLLRMIGEGYYLLCTYKCQEAIEVFRQLPATQYQTSWILNQVGRAHFEMVNYQEAAKTFAWSREIDPYRLKGLEMYSTVLWHMKREVELSSLAQDAVALDRHSQYAWCVMGNCFSLQKEHETALRYFLRALQVDNMMPYAHTLCGHEYFANEDFEKGITYYRNAIRIDPRHYNAWFGMGHIYYRQEKYSMAEYHFRRALTINERSSVLRCYLGMALHKLKRNAEALEALQAAINADPHNPLAKFEKAAVLMAEDRHEEALYELKNLKQLAPREASVLFHMGKIYKKLGSTQEALSCFSAALDLQPPSADTNLIKSAIDRIGNADGEEEDEI